MSAARRTLALLLAALLGSAACERAATRTHGGGPILVVDDVGRAVTLDAHATRIVSLIPAITDIIVELGAADRLLARTDYDVRPELVDLPSIGGGLNPSLEWLAARRPDLVIGWADRQSRAVIGRLADLGIASYAAEIETLDDIARTIQRVGILLGETPRADSLTDAIHARLTDTRLAVAARPQVRTLYVVSVEPLIVAGPGTFVHQLLETAGGINIAGDASSRWPHFGLEELVRRAPEAVILATGPDAAAAATRLHRAPGWSQTPAVRLGRVFPVDADLFNRPGPEIGRIAELLAAALHEGELPEAIGRAADSPQRGSRPRRGARP